MTTIHTIGFAGWGAAEFFGRLRECGARRVIDVRRRNTSTLAGFARRRDLPWFLRELSGLDYLHLPRLAPEAELLDAHRRRELDWPAYAREYRAALERRRIPETLPRDLLDGAVLLCSERRPEHCHRTLLAEALVETWARRRGGVAIMHLT